MDTGNAADRVRVLRLLSLLLAATCIANVAEPADREKVGQVFGEPVYRDQVESPAGTIREASLSRIFSEPVTEKYREAHRAEITPTEEEIEAATAYYNKAWHERERKSALEQELKQVDADLALASEDGEERTRLQLRKSSIEHQLKPLEREVVLMLVSHWKWQRHLYDKFGGGRVLWEQFGVEAFDATRKWLETQEAQGEFAITDPTIRAKFYQYWTTQLHAPHLWSNKEVIRTEFLEPAWRATLIDEIAPKDSSPKGPGK